LSGNRRLLLVQSGEEDRFGAVAGWETVPFPVCRLVAFDPGPVLPADHAIVTSRHAAQWFVAQSPRISGRIAASGPASAKVLQDAGFPVLVPQVLGGEAALLGLEAKAGERVLFPCARRTAGSVESACSRLGLVLDRKVVYGFESADRLTLPEAIDAAMVLSGGMVEHLRKAVPPEHWGVVSALPMLCLRGTASRSLESAGWRGPVLECEKIPGADELSSLLFRLTAISASPARREESRRAGGSETQDGAKSTLRELNLARASSCSEREVG